MATNSSTTFVDTGNGYCMEIEKSGNQYFMSLNKIVNGKLDPVHESDKNNYWYREASNTDGVMQHLAETMKMQPLKITEPLRDREIKVISCDAYATSVGKEGIFNKIGPVRKSPVLPGMRPAYSL